MDEGICLESCTFNKLLLALGNGKKSLAAAYKKRQREQEGRSDSKEDDAGSSKYSDSYDSEKASPGPSDDYSGDEYEDEAKDGIVHDTGISGDEVELQNSCSDLESDSDLDNATTMKDESKCGDEVELQNSDSDFESDSDIDNATTMKDESKCSYLKHLEHVLTNAEVDSLQKRIWKYTWEMPAFGSSASKWKGTGECPFKLDEIDSFSGLKLKLYKNWLEFQAKSGGSDFHSSRQWHFYSLCRSYRDLLYGDKKPFYLKGDTDLSVMDAYILHTLNHIYRARTLVTKNANKLAKNPDRNEIEVLNGGCFLDRGFTRPKVLLLLPFRSIALRVVKRLIQLTPPPHKNNVQDIDRFCNEFGTAGEDGDDEIDMARKKTTKPADFQVLFGGNISEEFMIGIKFTKGSIKLYSDFYSSDIIVASPVQLVHAIGKAEVEKDKDVDYLSSIEILIMDHADIIAMQNWSHVISIFEHLNTIPSDPHGTDIMRVRPWYLDGHARFYRQTILLGSYLTPDMNALFSHHCANYKGKVKFVGDHKGVIPKVLLPVRQVFERFPALSITEADDARFDYFVKKVFPKISDSIQGGIFLFISNYFDFVRVRNFLKSQSASFCLLGEYTKQSDISRARVWFFNGERKIMLYTERAHFYHRYTIRGIKKLIIYSLPERKEFYPEVVNMLDDAQSMCTVLFSRFDHLQLERIAGTTASKKMQSSDKDMFVFC